MLKMEISCHYFYLFLINSNKLTIDFRGFFVILFLFLSFGDHDVNRSVKHFIKPLLGKRTTQNQFMPH